MHIALATCQALPGADLDEAYLIQALKDRGHQVSTPVWTDDSIDYQQFDACVIRSTWDYQHQLQAFLAWAEKATGQTVLFNPVEVLQWNTDKIYLQQFEAAGFTMVPTQWFRSEELSQLSEKLPYPNAILKPSVSASALNTFQVTRATPPQEWLAIIATAQQAQKNLWLLQPFLSAVETEGELSLMYVNKQFAHAICKRPAAGDFRVQEHLGGQLSECDPCAEVIALGQRILNHIPEPLLYARVDLMQDDQQRWCLSELELTEPSLFFKFNPQTAITMAEALERAVQNARG